MWRKLNRGYLTHGGRGERIYERFMNREAITSTQLKQVLEQAPGKALVSLWFNGSWGKRRPTLCFSSFNNSCRVVLRWSEIVFHRAVCCVDMSILIMYVFYETIYVCNSFFQQIINLSRDYNRQSFSACSRCVCGVQTNTLQGKRSSGHSEFTVGLNVIVNGLFVSICSPVMNS